MDILLIAATAKEIEPFFEYYRNTKKTQNIDILITGIGLTATTYRLLKQLQLKRPALVIQAGVAGCFGIVTAPASRGKHLFRCPK